MAWLYGIGKAMTALGRDISATKREDEERQRQEEAAEARRDELGAMGTARMGMRTGALEPGTPAYDAAVSAISRGGGDPVSAMAPPDEPERFFAPVRTEGGWAQAGEGGTWQAAPEGFVPPPDAFKPSYRTQAGELGYVGKGGQWRGVEGAPTATVPEPTPVSWQRFIDEEGEQWQVHPQTGETRPLMRPDSVQHQGRVPGGESGGDLLDRYRRDPPTPPDDLVERQRDWDEAMADGLAQDMSREDVEGRIGPRPTG